MPCPDPLQDRSGASVMAGGGRYNAHSQPQHAAGEIAARPAEARCAWRLVLLRLARQA